MGLFKKAAKEPPAEPQVTKKHCRACNGVGNIMAKDYNKQPDSRGVYPVVEQRCIDCNGQGWTAA